MAKHYNSKVRHRDFQVGDLVLRNVTGATKDTFQGKLGPNWERPFIAFLSSKGSFSFFFFFKNNFYTNLSHIKRSYSEVS